MAAAAAAIIIKAIKASGAIVSVEPQAFAVLLGRNKQPLIIRAEGGLFKKNYQYLMSYKGLAFFTKSPAPLVLPADAELVAAKKTGCRSDKRVAAIRSVRSGAFSARAAVGIS